MAGNAALAQGDAGAALSALDRAQADAAGDKAMQSGIATDRARALVALKRDDEAAAALAEARLADPGNSQAWLLSATLSRRMNKLVEAQAQIEKAATLQPVDPGIGLEAGVIAVLSGHDEAARKSWQSVVAAAPNSDEAATAKGYLAQLGPAHAAATP
jgi:tetratricopeptide (TPR) repeat protein